MNTPREDDSYITILSKLYLSIRVEFITNTLLVRKFVARVLRATYIEQIIFPLFRKSIGALFFCLESSTTLRANKTAVIQYSINTILLANKRGAFRYATDHDVFRIRVTSTRIGVSSKISTKLNRPCRTYVSFRHRKVTSFLWSWSRTIDNLSWSHPFSIIRQHYGEIIHDALNTTRNVK